MNKDRDTDAALAYYCGLFSRTAHLVYVGFVSYIIYALFVLSNEKEFWVSVIHGFAVIAVTCVVWPLVTRYRYPLGAFGFAMFLIPYATKAPSIIHVPSSLYFAVSAYNFILMLALVILEQIEHEKEA